jgi:hypothetical protein
MTWAATGVSHFVAGGVCTLLPERWSPMDVLHRRFCFFSQSDEFNMSIKGREGAGYKQHSPKKRRMAKRDESPDMADLGGEGVSIAAEKSKRYDRQLRCVAIFGCLAPSCRLKWNGKRARRSYKSNSFLIR